MPVAFAVRPTARSLPPDATDELPIAIAAVAEALAVVPRAIVFDPTVAELSNPIETDCREEATASSPIASESVPDAFGNVPP